MPFGVTNAVPAFQRIMDSIIRKAQLQKTYAYLDDVIVAGETKEEHENNLTRFLEAIKDANITLNPEKSQVGLTSISLLGYIIENKTKRPNPEHTKSLHDLPLPTNTRELKRLLGLFAYNAKWVSGYSNKIQPLLNCLNQHALPLSEECIKAIRTIKEDIASACLTLPDRRGGPITIETDASGNAIGAVMSQDSRPIAYFSRTLTQSERNHSVIEREAMAVVESVRKWNQYVLSYETTIKTDQRSVAFLLSGQASRIKNEKLCRWRLELSAYKFSISYRPGKNNIQADTFSRVAFASGTKMTLSELHSALGHPGVTRMSEFIKRHNIPYTVEEIRSTRANCKTCLECKPQFYKSPIKSKIIKSTQPFERLGVDIVSPKMPVCQLTEPLYPDYTR